MPKISIYLDEQKLEEIKHLVNAHPHLTNRSALISFLIEQEIARESKHQMVEAAREIDGLNLGWNSEEQECAIIDLEASG